MRLVNANTTAVVHEDKPAPRLVMADPITGSITWQKEFETPNLEVS